MFDKEMGALIGGILLSVVWLMLFVGYLEFIMTWTMFRALIVVIPATYFYWRYTKDYWEDVL